MRRRRFVGLMGAGALGLGLPGSGVPGLRGLGRTGPEIGVWMGRLASLDAYREALDGLTTAGVTMVLAHVDAGLDTLPGLVALGAERGIRVHAWMPVMLNGSQLEAHPEWYAVSREGVSTAVDPPYVDYYRFLCPTRAPVRAWLGERIRQVARVPGLASVHLDYIRFPDVILPRGLWSKYDLVQDREYPPFDFCYCDACRAAFRARAGVDPLALPDPTADEQWRRFRWDAITRVVSELRDVVHAEGTALTAAVFPTPAIARRLVRQDWPSWPLDGVMPMIYNGFYEEPVAWVGQAVREGVAAVGGRWPLYAGLYVPDLDPPALARAARLALEAGADGVVAFDAGALTEGHKAALGTLPAS